MKFFDFDRHPSGSKKILISGTGGLIGHSLMQFLKRGGHQCLSLIRDKKRHHSGSTVFWNPQTGEAHKEDFEGFDAVVHLAGESLFSWRWSQKKKDRLFLTRCRDTWLLSQILTRLHRPPKIVITASAVGFYGNRGNELLTEESPRGKGFLSDLCVKWEESTASIEERGSRVVHPRFGPVLSEKGGMLNRLLPIFQLGLGGKLGNGKQYTSWIALEDVLGGIYHCLMTEDISGPVNFTAPNPVTNAQFTQMLAKTLHRPAFFHLPKPLLRGLCGEMADELLLASTRAIPKKLQESGFNFQYENLEAFLQEISSRL
jgi:hypothetical protein